jgi:hypothetical protein
LFAKIGDNDGKITPLEFEQLFALLGSPSTAPPDADGTDGTGPQMPERPAAPVPAPAPAATRQRSDTVVKLNRSRFDRFDTNKSGRLEPTEIQALIGSMDLECDNEYLKNVMFKFDRDGNGDLDYDEFAELWEFLTAATAATVPAPAALPDRPPAPVPDKKLAGLTPIVRGRCTECGFCRNLWIKEAARSVPCDHRERGYAMQRSAMYCLAGYHLPTSIFVFTDWHQSTGRAHSVCSLQVRGRDGVGIHRPEEIHA